MDKLGKVFMLDDDLILLDMYRSLLESHGFDVFTTDNAYKFILYAREIHPDIFILDINMPVMNGWEVVLRLKREERLKHIPVVMLTVRHDKRLAHAYGIANYLNKPLDAPGLLDVVESYCVGSKNHDILLLGDFWPESNILRTEMSRRQWVFFEVYDLEAAELYLSKNRPKAVCLGMPEDKCEQARLRLNHPLIMPLRNMQDLNNLERFIK
jgi:polar-differentiation response regulator divK